MTAQPPNRTLPSGTITFLFTDVVGSTQLWTKYPEAMKLAQVRHDTILRAAIEAYGGYVFKTVGDAFCAAFANAPDALNAALQAQRDLFAESWPEEIGTLTVRMGLHTGDAELRSEDYFGLSLSRVARLHSVGHGGQILLSLATTELVRDHLPSQVTLQDLGQHQLKDLNRPEHIFQVVASGLPTDFPPLKTLDKRSTNLPLQPTSFIGRERELAAAQDLVNGTRLLTLTGPGGTGKTRLALQTAANLADEFADGVYFVALAHISDPAFVIDTIARTLDVTESTEEPLVETLQRHLRQRELLLVLDNFEQVVNAAPLVGELLAGAPRLKILVTSREVLRLRGEQEFPVSPLTLPDPKRPASLPVLSQYESVELFIQRAQAVKPNFHITDANAPTVAEICLRLDGLPLAIELAAARVRLYTPQALLSRLDNRLQTLKSGARDVPARQQTLRDAIGWSYDLLDDGEQALFARLAVFVGGCTLEAAQAVCGEGLPIDVLEGLESLLNKSLLLQNENFDGEPRFLMLETIREYAAERLEASSEAKATHRRHAEYFLALAERAEPELHRHDQIVWLDRLDSEQGNIRAALSWALAQNDSEVAQRIASALQWFWALSGSREEGLSWLEKSVQISLEATHARAKALVALGFLLSSEGDGERGTKVLEEALALNRRLGDKRGIALAQSWLSLIGPPETRAELEADLAMWRELGDRWGIAWTLGGLGSHLQMTESNYAETRAILEEGLAISREVGDRLLISILLASLGHTALDERDHRRARALYEESIALSRELRNRQIVARTLRQLGNLAVDQADYAFAESCYRESLSIFEDLGATNSIAWVYSRWGQLDLKQEHYDQAREHFAAALRIWLALRRSRDIPFCLDRFAELAALLETPERAARLYGAAAALREEQKAELPIFERDEYERSVAAVREQLGEAAFEALWAKGQAMSLDEAIAYALHNDDDGVED